MAGINDELFEFLASLDDGGELLPADGGGCEQLQLLEGDVDGLLDALTVPAATHSVSTGGSADYNPSRVTQNQLNAEMESSPSVVPTSCATTMTTSTRGVTGKTKAAAPKVRRYNPNKARDEQKRELLRLRQRAAELERQHASLTANRPTHESLALYLHRVASCRVDVDGVEGIADMWRQLCMRQLEWRVAAERENVYLKQAVDNQQRVLRTIQRLLHEPATEDVHQYSMARKRQRLVDVHPTDPEVDRAIFAELLVEAETCRGEADQLLRENGLLNADEPRHGTRLREIDNRLYLDVFATSVLPFSFHQTSCTTWEFYKGAQKHHMPVHSKTSQNVGPDANTIMENFVIESRVLNVRTEIRVRQVFKRHVEPGRVVIMWVNDCRPVEQMHSAASFGFRDVGYVVCRPPRTVSMGAACDATVMQVCYRIKPYMSCQGSGRNATLQSNIDTIARFIVNSLEFDLQDELRKVESLLLRKQCGQQAGVSQTSTC